MTAAELEKLRPTPHRLQLKVLEAPQRIYETYGNMLNGTLCSPMHNQYFLKIGYPAHDFNRWCDVNSPLHYSLVDLALYYVTYKCPSCRQVLTTNADNSYSPDFFLELATAYSSYDIVLTDMVDRGRYFPVEPRRTQVDLGAYAVRTDFLRRTNSSFFKSLPLRPYARDYHDLDGMFIDRLVASGARVKHVKRVLFIHN
jgi:hypothetical protein